eukprot:2001224-Prymnesium_polylepis.1
MRATPSARDAPGVAALLRERKKRTVSTVPRGGCGGWVLQGGSDGAVRGGCHGGVSAGSMRGPLDRDRGEADCGPSRRLVPGHLKGTDLLVRNTGNPSRRR